VCPLGGAKRKRQKYYREERKRIKRIKDEKQRKGHVPREKGKGKITEVVRVRKI
jgi:hypothetical protein